MGGPAGIPYKEISTYLDDIGIRDVNERDTYITIIQALDNAFLELMSKKVK